MKVLVTGASGFVGRNLLEQAPRDWEITALWRSNESFPAWAEGLKRGIRPVRCDLTDNEAVHAVVGKCGEFDSVVHLAANGDPVRSASAPIDDLRETLIAALNLFSNVRAGQLVSFSSGAVYEGLSGLVTPLQKVDPILPYSITHYATERYAAWFRKTGNFGSAAVLRFFGAYGPHEPDRKIYTKLCRSFDIDRDNKFVLRGNGKNYIDAMYVDDAVSAIAAVLKKPGSSGVWDLAVGEPLTLRELVERAATIFDVPGLEIKYEGDVAESHSFRADASLFAKEFGFAPKARLEEGLPKLAAWLRKRDGKRMAGR